MTKILTAIIVCCLFTVPLFAGTTGKIAGRVVDVHSEPLAGVNIILEGTSMGASTDAEGFYYIINVPAGTYEVQFVYVGFKTRIVKDVVVNSDQTTTLEATLEEGVLQGETVVVVAERPIVELKTTSAIQTVSSNEIEAMPVLNLDDIVELQAGVVDGHFRGGRLGEVQYQLNGVSVNNSYNNSMSLQLDRSILEEVQVISGTFDAEYGQAMSGVVNVVLKSGSNDFSWNAESFISDYMYTTENQRNEEDKFRPFSIQNYQASLSGPTFLNNTFFLASLRYYEDNGYIYGERRFVPTDKSDINANIPNPTGDNKEVPLKESREITGLFKLTNKSINAIKMEYQAIFNEIDGKNYNFAFRLNPDGASTQNTFSVVHGLDISHQLSEKTFYNISLRQNYFDYSDYVYEDVYDPRYDAAGPPESIDQSYELGAIVQGVSLTRFEQSTNTFIAKAALTSQVNRENLVKIGAEAHYSEMKFGTPGYIVSSGGTLIRHVNEPPDYPGIQVYYPISLVSYAQDQIEWQDFIFRAGVRWEYFDAQSTTPYDLRNPGNVIPGAPEVEKEFKETTAKSSLAPRLGISYPVSETAGLFFAYGHFYQMPPLGQFFSNSNYDVLKNLQAGGISYGVLGNPDLKPERTVQYEFGYKQALTPSVGINLNVFFKDIRDLLGVEFITTYTGAEYARLTNVDFGNVLGYTITFDQRSKDGISTSLDYTWQRAMGNSSNPTETATRAAAGEDPRPRLIPLNWDQRHTLNLSVIYQLQNDFVLSTIAKLSSGQPYTPSIRSGFGGELEENSGRKNSSFRVDLRAEKFFKVADLDLSVYLRVLNLFDEDFVNGFVFADTGSPDYSLTPATQSATLANPNRYYPPRRIELGIRLAAN